MNRLYCIKCYTSDRKHLLAVYNFWNFNDAFFKMIFDLSEWSFDKVEDNETHVIWEGVISEEEN